MTFFDYIMSAVILICLYGPIFLYLAIGLSQPDPRRMNLYPEGDRRNLIRF